MPVRPLVPRLVCLIGLVCIALLAGCREPPTPPKKVTRSREQPEPEPKVERPLIIDGVRVELGNVDGRSCRRTLCIAGPEPLDSEANRDLDELCRRSLGVVKRCEGPTCTNIWPSERWQQALDGMLASLDANGDGKVDDRDPACLVSLAGWSTGAAIVARALPEALAERAQGRHARVRNVLAIAPYERGLERLDIASNVGKAFVYRNSQSPADDCSREFADGPWRSPAVVCAEGTTCYDYDYSLDSGDLAYLSRRGARSGAQIGHCNMPSVVAKIGLDNLAHGQEALRELIPPYVGGTHGGREAKPKPDPIVVLPNEP